VGELDAVLILTPKHARRVATRIRTLLGAGSDLVQERNRADQAIAYQRRKWMAAG
jgi:hypothetical protein